NDIGEFGLAAENHRKAYELRNRTTEAERYSIAAAYHKDVTGDINKAIEISRLWIQAYPRSPLPHDSLGGMILPVVGQYEKVVEAGNEAIRLNPDFPISYAILSSGYLALNRIDEAKAAFTRARERKLDIPIFAGGLYQIAFLEGDAAEMARQVAKTTGVAGIEDGILAMEAGTSAYSGRLKGARGLTRRAIDAAGRIGEKDP